MFEKSPVSLERRVCGVCGTEYDTGAILIDERLRPRLNQFTTTGWGLCPQHEQLFQDGFVALVECDPAKSGHPTGNSHLKPEHAFRTGRLAHLKREVFNRIFNISVKPDLPYVFVEPGVLETLQGMAPPPTEGSVAR